MASGSGGASGSSRAAATKGAVQLTDSQQSALTLAPKDARGNLAAIDGVPSWASSDETVATITANPDDRTAVLRANAPGTCRVTVTADADLGDGVTPIIGTLDVTVVAGSAVVVEITAGEPTEQTE